VHGAVDEARVVVVSLYVSWSIEPVDSEGIDRRARIIGFGVGKLHNPAQIVWIAGRLADKINMIINSERGAIIGDELTLFVESCFGIAKGHHVRLGPG